MASKEERRKALEAELAKLDAEEDEPEHTYRIGEGESWAEMSSKSKAGLKLNSWFKERFGIDLDDEPVQDEPEGDEGGDRPEPKVRPVHFRGNRAG